MNDMPPHICGSALRRCRMILDMTKTELAQAAKCSRSTIDYIEAHPHRFAGRYDTLMRILAIFRSRGLTFGPNGSVTFEPTEPPITQATA
jgi:DNA-binding XRE family transcriptional regulator